MSSFYCMQCGNKMEYKYSPPKFCSSCGESLGRIEKSKDRVREVNEEETDMDYVPEIGNLEVSVENEDNRRITLGVLWGQEGLKSSNRNESRSINEFLRDGKKK